MFCSVILFLFFNLAQSFCVVGERIVCVEGALELIFILTFIPSLVFSPPPVLFGMGMGGGAHLFRTFICQQLRLPFSQFL